MTDKRLMKLTAIDPIDLSSGGSTLAEPGAEYNITLDYITRVYLKLLDRAFSEKNLRVAHRVLESLEKLHFGKTLNTSKSKSRKAKSKDNASTH